MNNYCWIKLIQSIGKVSKFPLDTKESGNATNNPKKKKSFSAKRKRQWVYSISSSHIHSKILFKSNNIFVAIKYVPSNVEKKFFQQTNYLFEVVFKLINLLLSLAISSIETLPFLFIKAATFCISSREM